MEEVGYGEFGYISVISGLYIEKVWSYSDEEFNDLIEWYMYLINKDKNSKYGNN